MNTEKHDERKEEIIDAARRIFIRQGLNKSTLKEIAESINKKKSSIYYYFSSKEDILREISRREMIQARNLIESRIAHIDCIKERFVAYFVERGIVVRGLARKYGPAWEDFSSLYSSVPLVKDELIKDTHHLVTRMIDEGIERGDFKLHDRSLTILMIHVACRGFEIHQSNIDSEEDATLESKNLAKFLLTGLTGSTLQ